MADEERAKEEYYVDRWLEREYLRDVSSIGAGLLSDEGELKQAEQRYKEIKAEESEDEC